MEIAANRTLTSQLSDDLSWLEQYCGKQGDQQLSSNQLRLAAALVRNTIGPFLDGQAAPPLHVTVVGGAGTGKSTVVNLLTGTTAAEANSQAGYTRHPIAYTNANGAITWPSHTGFMGPLQRLPEKSPANIDKDVYQVWRVNIDAHSASLLKDFVVWDCPDMTTWAASGYVPRLLEVCGLADILLYVASDERYNDEVPTQFLRMLLQAGKPVICCLTKLRESDAKAFEAHFKEAVLSQLPGNAVNTLSIPWMDKAALTNPSGPAAKYRIMLLNQVAALGQPANGCRRRSVRLGMNYLLSSTDHLLSVARRDLDALENWRTAVMTGKKDFEGRYRAEFLETEKFRRFDEALVRLIDLLELPGVGRVISSALFVLRTPYRMFRTWLGKTMSRPDSLQQPELPVLESALNGWLDQLRRDAVRLSGSHPVWAHIEKGFESGTLVQGVKEGFQQGYRSFQLGLAEEVERTARAIYEELEKNPTKLNALRGGKFAMDIGAIVATLTIGHIGLQDFILVPLAASVTQQLVEWMGAQYVDTQREQTRNRQMMLAQQFITDPLSEWLTQWPATGGSNYERLQEALKRVPEAVQQLDQSLTQKLGSTL